MMQILKYLVLMSLLASCSKERTDWELKTEIKLNDVHPIGLTVVENKLWLADGDNNRLVQINDHGKIENQIKDLERPMHIASNGNTLLIPEYGKDVISTFTSGTKDSLSGLPDLDAPAGVFQFNKELVVADFYNNAIHYYNGAIWKKIGSKGTEEGKFNYPTDVQITTDHIFVADAYNHRVQVFDKSGKFIKVLGQNLGINAATGIYVSDQELFITDFENSRILIVSHKNELLQEIKVAINKPTDLLILNNNLYVTNYKSGTLSVYKR